MNKQGSFEDTRARFRTHLQATSKSAAPKAAEISTSQGVQENGSVPSPSSDPEVRDMTLGGQPGTAPKTLADRGVEFNEKLPGAGDPPKEEKKTEEVAPTSALKEGSFTEIGEIQNRLADNLVKLAAQEKLIAPAGAPAPVAAASAAGAPAGQKTALEAGGESNALPSGGKDLSLGTGEGVKSDTSGSVPVIQGTDVTQTEPQAGGAPKKLEQGTKEESVKSGKDLSLDEIADKTARFSQNVAIGRQIAFHYGAIIKAAQLNPADEELQKQAAQVESEIVTKTANSLVQLGLDQGIITDKQANALLDAAGFVENPLYRAIANVEQKMALLKEAGFDEKACHEFINTKVAAAMMADPAAGGGAPPMADPAAGGAPAGAGGAPGGPVDPAAMGGDISALLDQLHQAVLSGQMTEEQAIQILREKGLPVDQMLAQAGGAGGAAAGDPAAGDPAAAAAGGGAGAPPMGDPAAGAGAPPMADPAAAIAAAPAPGGAPAAPTPPAAPAIGGEAPVIAEAAPSAPATPKPDGAPKSEGGDKGEGGEKKKDGDGEKKKDGDGDKKKDDDKKDDKKEAMALVVTKIAALLAPYGVKLAAGVPGGAEDPTAGDSVGVSPEGGAPGAGLSAPGGAGAPGGDPSAGSGGGLEGVMAALDQAAQSGAIPPEVAAQVAQLLASAGGGGAPGGAAAGGSAAPTGGAPAMA